MDRNVKSSFLWRSSFPKHGNIVITIEAIFVPLFMRQGRRVQLHCRMLQLCLETRLCVIVARQNRRCDVTLKINLLCLPAVNRTPKFDAVKRSLRTVAQLGFSLWPTVALAVLKICCWFTIMAVLSQVDGLYWRWTVDPAVILNYGDNQLLSYILFWRQNQMETWKHQSRFITHLQILCITMPLFIVPMYHLTVPHSKSLQVRLLSDV